MADKVEVQGYEVSARRLFQHLLIIGMSTHDAVDEVGTRYEAMGVTLKPSFLTWLSKQEPAAQATF